MKASLKVARTANLMLSGMLTGNELSGLVAVYPALGRLPGLARLQAEQQIYRRYGTIMPVYMSSTLASAVPVLALSGDLTSPASRLTLAGAGCFAAMLAVTLTQNLPINARIVALPVEDASVEELDQLRERWDRLHAIRNALNVAGLAFTCLGALAEAD